MPATRHTFASRGDLASRSDPAARAVVAAWRRLTTPAARAPRPSGATDSDRRTLVACSGGADSAALAICLAGASAGARRSVVLGHVVHDLRPPPLAQADRDRTHELAQRLGVEFCERRVTVRALAGNAEANARAARYAALLEMALGARCPFVATAHHADDQLETLLMRLVRGSGLAGLAGVHASRGLGRGIRLVRPMLAIERADAERICTLAQYEPAIDATNADETRLRAALRAQVLPVLRGLNPGVASHAVEIARAASAAQALVRRRARRLVHSTPAGPDTPVTPVTQREVWISIVSLRRAGELVAAEAILVAARRAAGEAGLSIPRRTLTPLVRAIWSDQPRTRTFAAKLGRGSPRGKLTGRLDQARFTWRWAALA